MGGAVVARDGERRLAEPWELGVLRNEHVEGHFAPALRLAEDAEVTGEALGERVAGMQIEGDGETDRSGPEGMRRPPHAVRPEPLAQRPVDRGKRAGPADHVDAGQLGPVHVLLLAAGVAHHRLHRGDALLDERLAGLVDLVDGQYQRVALSQRGEVEDEAARVGVQPLLLDPALLEELEALLRRGLDVELLQRQLDDGGIEIVAAQAGDAGARHHLVRLSFHLDERGIEGPAAEVVDEHVLALARDRVAEPVRGRDKRTEKRVRLERFRFEFRVELAAEKPRVVGGLDDFDVIFVGRASSDAQARSDQRFFVVAIEFVAMAVAFADFELAVSLVREGTRLELAGPRAQAHSAAHFIHAEQLAQFIDYAVR